MSIKRTATAVGAAVTCAAGLPTAALVQQASAHEVPSCEFAEQPTASREIHKLSSSFSPWDGVEQWGINAFVGTDFTWVADTTAPGPSDSTWGFAALGGGTAGRTRWYYSNGSEVCPPNSQNLRFDRAAMFWNVDHTYINNNDRKCTTVHEMGHGVGLGHADGLGIKQSMMTTPHDTRCHDSTPVVDLTAGHDEPDVNNRYP